MNRNNHTVLSLLYKAVSGPLLENMILRIHVFMFSEKEAAIFKETIIFSEKICIPSSFSVVLIHLN